MFDYYEVEKIKAYAIIIIVLVGIVVGAGFLDAKIATKEWNNGVCTHCHEGFWTYEQAVGHKSSTSYIYICDSCGYRNEFPIIMDET